MGKPHGIADAAQPFAQMTVACRSQSQSVLDPVQARPYVCGDGGEHAPSHDGGAQRRTLGAQGRRAQVSVDENPIQRGVENVAASITNIPAAGG